MEKEAKFLSNTAIENALVYLGQPYDEKKLKHLSFSNFTKFYQEFEKNNKNQFYIKNQIFMFFK